MRETNDEIILFVIVAAVELSAQLQFSRHEKNYIGEIQCASFDSPINNTGTGRADHSTPLVICGKYTSGFI